MKKNFTNEQMIYTLRQVEGGTSVAEVCRKTGITEQTFYRWKRKFAGMGVAELARLRQPRRRKQEAQVSSLPHAGKHMLQEVLRNSLGPSAVGRCFFPFSVPPSDPAADALQGLACKFEYYYRNRKKPTELR